MSKSALPSSGITPVASACKPPFSHESSIDSSQGTSTDYESQYPAIVRLGDDVIRPKQRPADFIRWELETPALDRIHDHLWIAGTLEPAPSLHRHKLMRREIVITERADEHLLYNFFVIFVKPLPEKFLSFDFWQRNLCSDDELYRAACGFILSYTWLVSFECDFMIAQEKHLLPKTISWTLWIKIIEEFLEHVNTTPGGPPIARRYHYGALKARRINWIYRLPRYFTPTIIMCGYMPGCYWHLPWFERNVTRLLTIFVFFSIILSALQVGISTDRLQHNVGFQNASYGIAVASMVFVLFGALSLVAAWFIPRWYRLLEDSSQSKRPRR